MASVLDRVTRPDSYLSRSGFTYLKKLGAGASGVVGLFEKGGRQYAVKIIDINQLVTDEQSYVLQTSGQMVSRNTAMININKEIKNIQRIAKKGPPTCGREFDFVLNYEALIDTDENFYYLISEPMSNDLFGFFISDTGCRDPKCPQAVIPGLSRNRSTLVIAVICQLVAALYCFHKMGLVHGDLKPENVFINGSTGQIKIADFGGSGWIPKESNERGRIPNGTVLDKYDRQITASTLLYTAPERLADPSIISSASDMWSLGVLILALVAKNPDVVFNDILGKKSQSDINIIIKDNVDFNGSSRPLGLNGHSAQSARATRARLRARYDEEWVEWLLRGLLERDPARRLSITELVEDDRFSSKCDEPTGRVLNGTVGPSALGGLGLDLSELKDLKKVDFDDNGRFAKLRRHLSPRNDLRTSPIRLLFNF